MKHCLGAIALICTTLFATQSANALEWGVGCNKPAQLVALAPASQNELEAAKLALAHECMIAAFPEKLSSPIGAGPVQLLAHPFPGMNHALAEQVHRSGNLPELRLLHFLESPRVSKKREARAQ